LFLEVAILLVAPRNCLWDKFCEPALATAVYCFCAVQKQLLNLNMYAQSNPSQDFLVADLHVHHAGSGDEIAYWSCEVERAQ